VRNEAQQAIGDPKLVVELAIIGALRGNRPRDAARIMLSNGDDLEHYMIVHNFYAGGGGPGDKLSLVRLSQAFAEPVAMCLKKAFDAGKLKKRFLQNKLPPYLEFMGAGSLQMPLEFRGEHRKFAVEFSAVLLNEKGEKGTFNRRMYDSMERSAEKSRRFDFRRARLEAGTYNGTWEDLARELAVQIV
jgi:hypothetical protein